MEKAAGLATCECAVAQIKPTWDGQGRLVCEDCHGQIARAGRMSGQIARPGGVSIAAPSPHPTILRRAVLLCSDAVPEHAIQCDDDGRCPVHENDACALWFVPWADAARAARDGAFMTPHTETP